MAGELELELGLIQPQIKHKAVLWPRVARAWHVCGQDERAKTKEEARTSKVGGGRWRRALLRYAYAHPQPTPTEHAPVV
jgi:hypothetical protein